MKSEHQSSREITSGSIVTAYGALSALLLLGAAVALFEAAVAIRKKLSQCVESQGDDCHQLNNNDQSFDSRKTVLSSCCLKYKKKDRIPIPKAQHRRFSVQPQRSPQISITSTIESYDTSTIDSLSTYQKVYNPCETSSTATEDSQWFPLSRLKHMGAPHFNNPSRRISSPDWTGRPAWKGSRPSVASAVETQLSLSDRLARRSLAGQPAVTVLPLTPGVARLSNSLLDCYDAETQQSNKTAESTFQRSPQGSQRLLFAYQKPSSTPENSEIKSELPAYYRPELKRFSIQETPLIFRKM